MERFNFCVHYESIKTGEYLGNDLFSGYVQALSEQEWEDIIREKFKDKSKYPIRYYVEKFKKIDWYEKE